MKVEHNAEQHRFEIQMPEGMAVLDYRLRKPHIMELTHTFTPGPARGRGVAAELVRGGLDYARANQFRVIPSCWYAEAFFAKHAEYADLLMDDDGSPRAAPACEI